MSVLTRVLSKLNSYNILNPSLVGKFSMAVISFVLLCPFCNMVLSTLAWECMKVFTYGFTFFSCPVLTLSPTLLSCFLTLLHPSVQSRCFHSTAYSAGEFSRAAGVKIISTAAFYLHYLAFVYTKIQLIREYFLNVFGNYIVIDWGGERE